MKLIRISLQNFRGYKNIIDTEFQDLTAFVGKNDVGKSTILEAMDIFFNEGSGIIKLDKDDINIEACNNGDENIIISAVFADLPSKIVIDSTNETTLQAEYLTNSDGELEVIKKYPKAGKEKVFVRAYHPTNPLCAELLLKSNSDLKKILDKQGIECANKTINAFIRNAIWKNYESDLDLDNIEIEINKGDTKEIWQKLKTYMPIYSLFQSDRKNSDGDSEIQDPLKEAVKQILKEESLQQKLNEVAIEVEAKLKEVSDRTLEKLLEMSPEVASTLNPIIPSSANLKWNDVFKNVSISGDENIPINKRGSGVKRLILLNFFRAEAERKLLEDNSENIIYAIEEPETSQHTYNQLKLIDAFRELSQTNNTQVIVTTHSANIVKRLNFDNLRLISNTESGKCVECISPNSLPYPSLNEVNFIAFNEISEEYHNELYGFIEAEDKLEDFRNGKPTIAYTKQMKSGTKNCNIILTEYVRHQIHHPENTLNQRFSSEQLKDSIDLMRDFILNEMHEHVES